VSTTRPALVATLVICGALVAGCGAPGAPAMSAVIASPQPSTPPAAGTPSAAPGVAASASPGPNVPPANVEVSPPEVHLGAIVMSLAFEPARHMVDRAMLSNAANIDPARPTLSVPDGATRGALVLDDMLRVTNNMDPTQQAPPDSATSVVRHAILNVKSGAGNQQVPYLTINMDMLLDGRPVSFGQSVVPMVASEANPPSMYYGNNVRLAQRGMYQVFVRMSYNPLLGNGQPQAAQFNVIVQ
jgi:hypothetical protein